MKTITSWILILWAALVFELARPESLPSGSVVLPVAIGCVFLLRNGTGILIVGTALLVQWILNTTSAPLDVVATLLLAGAAISPGKQRSSWSPAADRKMQHAWWVQPAIIMAIALTLHTAMVERDQLATMWSALAHRIFIAVPVLALILIAAKATEQLGLRQGDSVF
jgi:hypothetical protein